ncbi:VWA domain-containing protein [candidate division KSB1 bacterium]|nr:VWA domain-containing protein [candidate division KSB1 bacterium]
MSAAATATFVKINTGYGKVEQAGYLLSNLLLFGRLLRRLGLDVNAGRMLDLMQALGHIQIGRKSDFYYTARSLLVHRHEDLRFFDQAFELFWRKPAEEWTALNLSGLNEQAQLRKPPNRQKPLLRSSIASSPSTGQSEQSESSRPQIVQTYSDVEILRRKDFAEMSVDELKRARELIAELVWQLGERRTRRKQPGAGSLFDLRRTLRRNLKYGGEVLKWARREPKFKPRPLVVIADISGSMERYTNLLLQFIYSLSSGLNQVEAFVFSTRLTRISKQLHNRDAERALKEVAHCVTDWAGGTRIGEALKDFNFRWGRRVLGRSAVVMIISDGWDRGDIPLLRQEMARLSLSSHRLIWLNPLLGHEGYEPLTQGMSAALPYVDDFLPVHNLVSLEQLGEVLAAMPRF